MTPATSRGEREEREEREASAMFYQMSAARLRSRCLYAGVLLLLSIFVPYEMVYGRGIFVWSVFAELEVAAKVAAVSPAVSGLLLILLSFRTRASEGLLIERPTTRAIAVIAIFLGVNVALLVGKQSSAWGILPLPDSLTTRPAPFVAVFALTAAGAVLRFHNRSRKVGSILLLASVAAALAFYLWPSRAEIPAQTILRAVVLVATLPDTRFQIGYGMVLLFILGPFVISLLGLVYVNRVPKREQPGVSVAAVWGVPALMLMFVYRAFIAGGVGMTTLTTAFFAILLVFVVSLLATSLEVLLLGITSPDGELGAFGGLKPAVAGGIAGAILVGLGVALSVLGRPAPKGTDWTLGPSDPAWDNVFSKLLPNWDRARWVRDEHIHHEHGTGAEAQVATLARARELLSAVRAQPQGKDVAVALENLTSEVDDLELSGRAFGRLVADINEASRKAQLPYYLDPSVRIYTSEKETRRLFDVTPYRVKEVHGWKVGEDRFATLLVEPLGSDAHAHLGFSRDQDPFALVLTSEIRWYTDRFVKGDEACGKADSLPNDRAAEVTRCQTALTKVRDRLGAELEKAIVAGTERHELQHQVDGPHLPLSRPVLELLAGFTEDAQDRANRELSAYIAEMTTPNAPPHLTLLHLFPFGIVARGGAEHRVSVLLFETLSGRRLRFGAREVDPETYGQAFEEQMGKGDDELREAARKAYKLHFGVDLREPSPEEP